MKNSISGAVHSSPTHKPTTISTVAAKMHQPMIAAASHTRVSISATARAAAAKAEEAAETPGQKADEALAVRNSAYEGSGTAAKSAMAAKAEEAGETPAQKPRDALFKKPTKLEFDFNFGGPAKSYQQPTH